MGFRFRNIIRVLPGVRLNVSGGGVSASFGRPGATINVGKRGIRGTAGVPGSGMSYSKLLPFGRGRTAGAGWKPILVLAGLALLAFIVWRAFAENTTLGSSIVPTPTTFSSEAPRTTAYVSASDLNCRTGPSVTADVTSRPARGEKLAIIGVVGEWTQVEGTSARCWVASRYLSASPVAVAPPSGDCACSTGATCAGPRGGRYCLTSGRRKRYVR